MLREAPRHDLRNAVRAHRHAVEDIRGLHRPLLVSDDDKLRPIGVAPEELDEARDVRVVERGLDLVEEVEGARPREEEREQERDRSERLLAAREERQARDALARPAEARPRSPASPPLVLRLDETKPALAAGKEGRGDILEVRRDGGEGLGEAPLDGLGELRAQLVELLEALLEILALRRQVGEALLLAPRTPRARAG